MKQLMKGDIFMNNQYSYYTPEQDDMDCQTGNMNRQDRRKNRKVPSVIKVIGLGLVFGVVASSLYALA